MPLTIVNQTGWWIKNPVGFTATWGGSPNPGDIHFDFDSPDPNWNLWINSQFGEGIITWNTPFLFRTEPVGSRLLICGPTNYFRQNVHPLTALIESDWMTMSFTMNYKIMKPNEPVRFEFGEPLFQVIPLISNVCSDLEQAEVRYQRLAEDPEMLQAYQNWSTGRTNFHKAKARQEVKPDQWQKDYFQGRDASGQPARHCGRPDDQGETTPGARWLGRLPRRDRSRLRRQELAMDLGASRLDSAWHDPPPARHPPPPSRAQAGSGPGAGG